MENIGQYERTILTRKGKRIAIRPPQKEDIDELLHFINDLVDEDTFIMMNRRVTREEEIEYLSARLKAIEERRGFNLVACHGTRIVANAGIDLKGSRQEHVAELGISVSRGFRDEGLGSSFLEELLTLAKGFLNPKIILLHVFENNIRARHVYGKIGFQECGRMPRGIYHKGQYIDDILMYLDMERWKSS